MNNIFDLKNLDDLPDIVKSRLKKNSSPYKGECIIQLFAIKSQLSTDEIMAGLYRKYKIMQQRGWLANILHRLSKKNKIKRVPGKRGFYQLGEEV